MKPIPPGSGSEYPSLGPALDFVRLVWAVDHALHQKSVKMHRTVGVTGQQRLVVRIVGRFPGISLGRLAKLLGAHPSSATGLVKRLFRLGLVRTRTDPRDARRQLLGLTPRGRAIEITVAGTVEEAAQRLLDEVTLSDVATASAVLGRLREILLEDRDAISDSRTIPA